MGGTPGGGCGRKASSSRRPRGWSHARTWQSIRKGGLMRMALARRLSGLAAGLFACFLVLSGTGQSQTTVGICQPTGVAANPFVFVQVQATDLQAQLQAGAFLAANA